MKIDRTFVTGGFRCDTCDADTFALVFRINSVCEVLANADDDTPVVEAVFLYHADTDTLDVDYQFTTEFGCAGNFPSLDTLLAALIGAGFSEYSMNKNEPFTASTLEYWRMAIDEAASCVDKLIPSLKQLSEAATPRSRARLIEDGVKYATQHYKNSHFCRCGSDD